MITLATVVPTGQSTNRPATEPTTHEPRTHFPREQAHGQTPTDAEQDRIAGTNHDGRTVPRQCRDPLSVSSMPPALAQNRASA